MTGKRTDWGAPHTLDQVCCSRQADSSAEEERQMWAALSDKARGRIMPQVPTPDLARSSRPSELVSLAHADCIYGATADKYMQRSGSVSQSSLRDSDSRHNIYKGPFTTRTRASSNITGHDATRLSTLRCGSVSFARYQRSFLSGMGT